MYEVPRSIQRPIENPWTKTLGLLPNTSVLVEGLVQRFPMGRHIDGEGSVEYTPYFQYLH